MKDSGPRLGLICSAVFILIGFFLSSRLSRNVIMLYVSYAGITGSGIGCAYNILISAAGTWFPNQKGSCSGVLMMSFGLSSLLLGKLADTLFVLNNFGWRKSYLLFGVVIAAVVALSGLVIKLPTENTVFPKAKEKKLTAETFRPEELTTRKMARRSSFIRFYIYAILTSAVGSTVISFARDLSLSVGATAALATTLVGVLSLCNGIGRVLCGILFDAMGRKRTMVLANLITILAPFIVLLSVKMHSLSLCIAGLCLTGFCYGCSPTISSAFIGTFYGMKHFSSNFSLANTMLIPSSFAATIASALLEHFGSYAAPFTMLIIFAAIALALNLSIRRP